MHDLDTHSNKVQLLEQALQEEVLKAVKAHISKLVQPQVDAMVKQLATEAVSNWAIGYKAVLGNDFSMGMNISIRFVESIIKTIPIENDIKIEVHNV